MEQKVSKHYQEDRKKREQIIQLLIGEGEEVDTFRRIDEKGRVTYHTITTTGIIIVKTATEKIVTKIIASPNQIKRYFDVITEQIQAIIDLAAKHMKFGYSQVQKKHLTKQPLNVIL